MDVITTSIKNDVEIQLNKPIEKVEDKELLQVKNITINRLDYDGNINDIDYNDILYFVNLEELSIFNCMIDKTIMDNILNLKKLKILKIYNSDFVDYINDWFSNLNLEELTISNCLGLNDIVLGNLKYLNLKNIDLNFSIGNVDTLDISNTIININDLSLYNVRKIIISKKNYDENTNFKNIQSNIVIVDDKMEIIREINND